ncbi:hypothetical protein [Natrialba asiatica]|uniref:Uncharacterized protein n=1 Tax=Natrialba asiatica (strain ATCC 700177 / DSM 12278 / JCM 9576 / FERM P-10747 / NBRC 102637 / 172P1) TaxID=29540 RepID=M0ASN5_NATA1|nr:hypothetical protein [Natrialba asiatica]ELZ00394.1 hypothetical protein C481_12129 [Natrialba asiatica DSM 12278]
MTVAGLITTPGAVQAPALVLLPVSPGSNLITLAMLEGTKLREFPLAELVALLVTGVGCLVGGYSSLCLWSSELATAARWTTTERSRTRRFSGLRVRESASRTRAC